MLSNWHNVLRAINMASSKSLYLPTHFPSPPVTNRARAAKLPIPKPKDDDDAENAMKAADDQDHITLSEHVRRAASRLRISLDLSPQDAAHERLSAPFTYPEWNQRTRSLMPDHTRVLEAEGTPGTGFAPDARLVARVRRQFAPLHPRRVLLSRQIEDA